MTIDETIARLDRLHYKIIHTSFCNKVYQSEIEALLMAIEALERQKPKKVIYRKQSYGTPWLCPECETDQIKVEFFSLDGGEPKEKHSFCWKCGQKIDWDDEGSE